MNSVVDSLKNMATSLDNELRSLLAFYGEQPDSPEAPKAEDFFGLILSFSSSLQKAALEVHDAMPKVETRSPQITVEQPASPTSDEGVSIRLDLFRAGIDIYISYRRSRARMETLYALTPARTVVRQGFPSGVATSIWPSGACGLAVGENATQRHGRSARFSWTVHGRAGYSSDATTHNSSFQGQGHDEYHICCMLLSSAVLYLLKSKVTTVMTAIASQ